MSVVLICFPGAPKVSPEAVKKEADLDKYLEGRVEGTFDKHLIRLSFLVLMLLGPLRVSHIFIYFYSIFYFVYFLS